MRFLILNGPNLNMLGIREPAIYGAKNFAALERFIHETCEAEGVECTTFQSNYEGALVEKIQEAYGVYDGIVINPAAYTHTSVALLDAIKSVAIPTVEVHLSKVEEREPFRQISYVSYAAIRTITGMGFDGYAEAIRHLKAYLANEGK